MDTQKFIIVAIDGGAASGKSSTAKGLSSRFTLMHVDTGSFYRALTRKLLDAGIAPEEGPALQDALNGLELGTTLHKNSAQITINGWLPILRRQHNKRHEQHGSETVGRKRDEEEEPALQCNVVFCLHHGPHGKCGRGDDDDHSVG